MRENKIKEFDTQTPPHNIEAELSVIGAVLLNNNVLNEIIDIVKPEDFYSNTHRIIFQTIVELYEKNTPVDLVILREELEKRGLLEKIGSFAELAELVSSVPGISNVEYYARIIKEKAILRKLIETSMKTIQNCYRAEEEPKELLDRVEKEIFDIAELSITTDTVPLKDVLKQTLERLDVIYSQNRRIIGIPTGYIELDEITNGFQESQLIIIAGRPSMGKTTFALNIMERMAVEENLPVVFFSLEMSKEMLGEMLLCSYARVEPLKVTREVLTAEERERFYSAMDKLSRVPIYIDDSSRLNPLDIRAKARRLKRSFDIKAIFIDYLQLIEDPGTRKSEGRQQEIANISRAMKSLARELKIPVILLSQLNRSVEKREDHKPRMSDLRESGAIEQDADLIMLLHRNDYYDKNKDPGILFVNVAKQRTGPVGEVKLFFRKEIRRIENLSRDMSGMVA